MGTIDDMTSTEDFEVSQQEDNQKRGLAKLLDHVPRLLSSKVHIIFLTALLVYLVILPLVGVYTPSAQDMLIGGNWTNVTGDLGACIAAGGTVVAVKHLKHRAKLDKAHRKWQVDVLSGLHLKATGYEAPIHPEFIDGK